MHRLTLTRNRRTGGDRRRHGAARVDRHHDAYHHMNDMMNTKPGDRGPMMSIVNRRAWSAVGRLDLALTLLLGVLAVGLMAENKYASDGPGHVPIIALPLFVAVALALLWRSIDPLFGLGVVIVTLGLHFALFGELVRCGVAVPVIALITFSAAVRLDRREAYWGLGLGLAAMTLLSATDFLGFGIIGLGAPVTVLAWIAGRVARSRAATAEKLRTRNAEIQAARDERARLEVNMDREHLSAELESVLHRRLAELAVLADEGASSVGDDSVVALLADIERESRTTLDEMRALVGVLRSDGTAAVAAPQPTLASLEALLIRDGDRGARLHVQGSPRALPAGVELTAYRVVEHLLDALDTTPDVRVLVRFAPDVLELTIEGSAGRRGRLGAALGRARQRVELHKGSLSTETNGGRASVVAVLPLRAS
jgi:signal transduction histidine kinase